MDRFPSMYIADCCVRDTWWSCRRIGPCHSSFDFFFSFCYTFFFFFFLLLLLFFFLLIVCFGFSLVDDCCCFTHCLLVVRINSSTISTYSYINLYDMVFSYQHNGHGYWHWVCTNMFSLIQPHTDGGRGQRMVLAPCRSVALSLCRLFPLSKRSFTWGSNQMMVAHRARSPKPECLRTRHYIYVQFSVSARTATATPPHRRQPLVGVGVGALVNLNVGPRWVARNCECLYANTSLANHFANLLVDNLMAIEKLIMRRSVHAPK